MFSALARVGGAMYAIVLLCVYLVCLQLVELFFFCITSTSWRNGIVLQIFVHRFRHLHYPLMRLNSIDNERYDMTIIIIIHIIKTNNKEL